MQLPPALRQAVDAALDGIPRAALAAAQDVLSQRYRNEVRDGRAHLADDVTARAYLAARLPATYAAVRAALDAVAERRPDFAPRSLLDFGAGPGTVLWAARDCWLGLERALLIETSNVIRAFGLRLARESGITQIDWQTALDSAAPHDLVTIAYVLDELDPDRRAPLIDRLWSLTGDTLLIVEPGTSAGWRRILDARRQLLDAGAHLVAPCPHTADCPLVAPDWCHFSRRVARSRVHLQAKDADVPWEDEKFIYLAVSRHSLARPQARVIAAPRAGSGKVELKLCSEDGSAYWERVTRRQGDRYKRARRAEWGDVLSSGLIPPLSAP
jgi:ribosomal protein RSM22 (predicted rRNA methylase)